MKRGAFIWRIDRIGLRAAIGGRVGGGLVSARSSADVVKGLDLAGELNVWERDRFLDRSGGGGAVANSRVDGRLGRSGYAPELVDLVPDLPPGNELFRGVVRGVARGTRVGVRLDERVARALLAERACALRHHDAVLEEVLAHGADEVGGDLHGGFGGIFFFFGPDGFVNLLLDVGSLLELADHYHSCGQKRNH